MVGLNDSYSVTHAQSHIFVKPFDRPEMALSTHILYVALSPTFFPPAKSVLIILF